MSTFYTVTQVNEYISNMFKQDFLLNRVYIKGEVSNCKYHSSGHIYFTLKDENAAIACVMFAGNRKNLAFRLEDGQNIIAFGQVGIFEKAGRYQLYATAIRLDGLGVLYERFEALKKELSEMGMFDAAYKQPIPKHIRTLGVVTAPTGAAVRDIINVSKRRNPGIQIILYPAKVQGEGAAESVAYGIQMLERQNVDTIIIGRGGGSIEDLWAFNEEIVARAVFDCSVPIISAVGHETDTVISDYVADMRAPTPSAAAELAVSDVSETLGRIRDLRSRLNNGMDRVIRQERERLNRYSMGIQVRSPQTRINDLHQMLAIREDRIRALMDRRLTEARSSLLVYNEKLKGLSPYEKLSQGYGFVTTASGSKITETGQVKAGDEIEIYLADGRISAQVKECFGNE